MLDLFAFVVSVDPPSLLAWLVFTFAAGMYPLGIMLGASCSPCCGRCSCGVPEGIAGWTAHTQFLDEANVGGTGSNAVTNFSIRPYAAHSIPCCNGSPAEITARIAFSGTVSKTENFACPKSGGFSPLPNNYTVSLDASLFDGDYVLQLQGDQAPAGPVAFMNNAYTRERLTSNTLNSPPSLPSVGAANVVYTRSWPVPLSCGVGFPAPRRTETDAWIWDGSAYASIAFPIRRGTQFCVSSSPRVIGNIFYAPEEVAGITEYKSASFCTYVGGVAFGSSVPGGCTDPDQCPSAPFDIALRVNRYPLLEENEAALTGFTADDTQTMIELQVLLTGLYNPCPDTVPSGYTAQVLKVQPGPEPTLAGATPLPSSFSRHVDGAHDGASSRRPRQRRRAAPPGPRR